MRRFLVALGGVLLLAVATFLLFFTASGYRGRNQPYVESLSDFVFMVGSYGAQTLDLDPPELTPRRYRRTMAHARYRADPEVRERVVFRLASWGEEVVPRLLAELASPETPERATVALRALAKIGHHPEPDVLERLLLLALRPMESVRLVEAMAELGPRAAPALIAHHERLEAAGETIDPGILAAIGETGGGAAFLLAEMEAARRAGDPERIHRLLWPLALTRDRAAAEVLVELLHHPRYEIRRRSRDAMAQSMPAAAVAPAVELLARETDDYVRSWIIQSLLAGRHAASSERVVPLLSELLDDPVLSWEANYALARIASEEAIEALAWQARAREPRWVMDNLEYSGPAALRILTRYLRDEDPEVRRAALDKALELGRSDVLALLERAAEDEEPGIRSLAGAELFRHDVLLLGESFAEWLAGATGAPPVPVGRLPAGSEIGPGLAFLSFVNWIGLATSLAVGLLLLFGWLRAFEHYRFALAIQFLLVLGIVGDFFFIREPGLYPWATAVRLLLLLGLLFLRDDPLPGTTRGRVERLALRSLWVLAPLLVVFGAPPFAAALRLALRDFDFMKWALLLLLLLAVLLLEEVVLPWQLLPRSRRVGGALSFLLTAGIVVLFVVALWWSPEGPTRGSEGRSVVGTLVTLLLASSLVFHLKECGLFAPRVSRPSLAPAPGRLRAFFDGESLVVRVRRKRRWGALLRLGPGLLFLVATWWLSHHVSGAPGLVVLLVFSLLGLASMSVLVLGLVPSYTVQIRDGAARGALTFLGGALGRAAWHRRIRLPALLEATGLGTLERRWLSRALDRRAEVVPEVELSLRVPAPGGEDSDGLELEVKNVGRSPVELADLERRAQAPWYAEVSGRRADVYFSRAERERPIGPGETARFRPRLFGGEAPQAGGSVLLRCGALEARSEPA